MKCRVFIAIAVLMLTIGVMPAIAFAADSSDPGSNLVAGEGVLEAQSDAGSFTVSAQPTDLQATLVSNSGGYASVTCEDNGVGYEPLQALVDKNGNAVFGYTRSWTGYVYWDGIVVQKFTGGSRHNNYYWFPTTTGAVKTGFYNLDGTEAFESGYDQIRNIGKGYAVVMNAPDYKDYGNPSAKSECYVIDRMGNKVITLPEAFCKLSYAYQTTSDGKCIFIQYSSNLGAMSDGLMGFATTTTQFGNTIFDCTPFDKPASKWSFGIMDAAGNVVIAQNASSFDTMYPYNEGLAAAVKWSGSGGGTLSYVDKDQNVIIPGNYYVADEGDVRSFNDGMVAVCQNGSWGYMNRDCETLIPFMYEDALTANDGLCPVKKDGKYGIVDYKNNTVVPFEYDDMSTYVEGVVYAVKDGKLVILSIVNDDLAGVNRLKGDVALDTMANIVKEGDFASNGTVVLSTVDGYWDALTAAGIAGMAHAPVLMTDGNSLSPQTAELLKNLSPKRVIVCGGAMAVTDGVLEAASAAAGGAETVRCAGDNAVGTAIDIFNKAMSTTKGSWARTAFICTNEGYWDALAAAPLSYAKNMPIMLADGNNSISPETIAAMSGKIDQVYIVGGVNAITPAVEDQLRNAGITVAGRLAGDTAIETSEEVSKFGLQYGMSAEHLGIATVNGYWDALSGAALCGKQGSVLVLVDEAGSHSISGFIKEHAESISGVYVFGGEAAINRDTAQAISAAL